MADKEKKEKGFSVAAFLFMPQFHLSFQHLSFIKPVFIRTIAMVMEQAELLPANHPATQYGLPGVKKYGFFQIMGEAWHNLRNKDSNTYQWSIFISIYLMVAAIFTSFASAAMAISGVFVTSATAQLFSKVAGGANGTAIDTGINSLPNGTGGGGLFNQSVTNNGGHADFGIMIIDKLFREGVMNKGGILQNAFGSLMQVYNSAVLVIAGIMLFWIVLSVVIDTAKTGQIGGGRHNMVWAPIRIVFAIGLLIPLGSSGFSSGQFGVMKLAEWGSNLGSNGWSAYVSNITDQFKGDTILGHYGLLGGNDLLHNYERMWICRIAYNAYAKQANALDSDTRIVQNPKDGDFDAGSFEVSFTNDSGTDICGSIKYTTVNNPSSAAMALYSPYTNMPMAIGINKAMKIYEDSMSNAYASVFIDLDNPNKDTGGTLEPTAKEFACGFVSQHIVGEGGVLSPALVNLGCNAGNLCDAELATPGGSKGRYPTAKCIKKLRKDFIKAIDKKAEKARDDFIKAVDKFLDPTETKKRGWTDMAFWYSKIGILNNTVSKMSIPNVSIKKGFGNDTTYVDDGKGKTFMNGIRGIGELLGIGGTETSKHSKKAEDILTKYEQWWSHLPLQSDNKAAASTPASMKKHIFRSEGKIGDHTPTTDSDDVKGFITGSPIDVANKIFEQYIVFPISWIFDAIDPIDKNLYPLAMLAKVGNSMEGMALYLYGLSALVGLGGDALSAISKMIVSLATVFFGAAVLLKFYIPILPIIKVSFAVLTWMISIFEAVVMVPIAALAHITTQGEGLAGAGKQAWIVWLNVLLRPILTVIGFIGALLVLNTFVVYFNATYIPHIIPSLNNNAFAYLLYSVIYVFVIYTVANSSFKLLDIIPAAMFKYMGGSADQSMDQDMSGSFSQVGSATTGQLEGASAASGQGLAAAGRGAAEAWKNRNKTDVKKGEE